MLGKRIKTKHMSEIEVGGHADLTCELLLFNFKYKPNLFL